MTHLEQTTPPATAGRPPIGRRRVSGRHVRKHRVPRLRFARAEMAFLLLLAALPPVALWSTALFGGGAAPVV